MSSQDAEKRREYDRLYRIAHKEERREEYRQWRARNLEKAREATRKWREAHPEHGREYQRRRREENPEENHKATREWRIKNPDKVLEYKRKRRAAEANTVDRLTAEQAREILQAGCLFCGSHEDLVIAHDTPVSKGGATTRGNTFCLCRKCNSKMYTKSLVEKLKQLFF